jgi:hypothetical protein
MTSGELQGGWATTRNTQHDDPLKVQIVQQIDERIGKSFSGCSSGGGGLSIARSRGDDKLVSQFQQELFRPKWRVAVGVSTIEHKYCWSLPCDTILNGSFGHMRNEFHRYSRFVYDDDLTIPINQIPISAATSGTRFCLRKWISTNQVFSRALNWLPPLVFTHNVKRNTQTQNHAEGDYNRTNDVARFHIYLLIFRSGLSPKCR